jgi:uncharacterized damage-inducible protein DinB
MIKYIIFLLLVLPSGPDLAAQKDTIFPARAEWLKKWENSKNYTLEALQLIPDSSLTFRPTEDQMSVREQIQHISGNVYGLSRRFLDYEPDTFDEEALREKLSSETLSREELTTLLTDAFAFGAAAINKLPAARWEEEVTNFFAGPKSRRVIIYLLQDHATHHRAQVLIYMRLIGLTPPRYRGW